MCGGRRCSSAAQASGSFVSRTAGESQDDEQCFGVCGEGGGLLECACAAQDGWEMCLCNEIDVRA